MADGVLALDLATATGWAVWQPGDAAPRHGTCRLPKTGRDIGRFLHAFEGWLRPFLEAEAPWRVVFEAPILRAGQTDIATARKLMCLAGVTEMVAHRAEVPVFEQGNQDVRKHFIGNGKAPRKQAKDKTMRACRARGWHPRDDNAADALALLDYVAALWGVAVPWDTGAFFRDGEPQG